LVVCGGGAVLAVGYWLRAATQEQAAVVQAQQAEAAQVQAAAVKIDLTQFREMKEYRELLLGKTVAQIQVLLGTPARTTEGGRVWWYTANRRKFDPSQKGMDDLGVRFDNGVVMAVE